MKALFFKGGGGVTILPRVPKTIPNEIKVRKCDEHVTGAAQIESG